MIVSSEFIKLLDMSVNKNGCTNKNHVYIFAAVHKILDLQMMPCLMARLTKMYGTIAENAVKALGATIPSQIEQKRSDCRILTLNILRNTESRKLISVSIEISEVGTDQNKIIPK